VKENLIPGLDGDRPDLFLSQVAGGILWMTRQPRYMPNQVPWLIGSILLWNRKHQRSECLFNFGLN